MNATLSAIGHLELSEEYSVTLLVTSEVKMLISVPPKSVATQSIALILDGETSGILGIATYPVTVGCGKLA